MSKRNTPQSLEDLDARLRAARAGEDAEKGKGREPGQAAQTSGIGLAFRFGIELVAAVLVGVGIGIALDMWLGTRPWLMILFLFLGGAAGVMNVYRTAQGLDDSVGLGLAQARKNADRKNGS